MRHLVTLDDLTAAEFQRVFEIAADLKAKYLRGVREPLLPGRTLALLFEKQSLRTRVSFEAAITHLGGDSIMLGDDAGFGARESIGDFARVLGGMVDAIVVRSKQHATVVAFAQHSRCSVINGLTDEAHPCQAMADLYTLRENVGALAGRKLTWVGDGNNVVKSLARGCRHVGMQLVVCTPAGHALDPHFVDSINADQAVPIVSVTQDPEQAVRDTVAVYTDVWASMGQEAERETRRRDFADYQVNSALMSAAPPDAVFMHCLPARRGEEVTDDVIDGSQSVVLEQAANRMHVQKGILSWMLEDPTRQEVS